MSGMDDPSSHDPHEALNHLAQLMQKELDDLLQQKASLRRRMQKLHRVLRQLRVGRDSSASNSKPSKSNKAAVVDREKARTRRALYEQLWRACRIAFLEMGGIASSHQVYELIKRRGSFSFDALDEEPLAAITRILHLMANAGEAERTGDQNNPTWRYMTAK